MKKYISTILMIIVCMLFILGAVSPKSTGEVKAVSPKTDEVSVRFLNMLNHNNVYNNGFASFDSIATGAIISSLSVREGDYIPESYLKGFISDMYGINITNFEDPSFSLHRPGYVHIPAMGITRYTHSNISATKNEDGTYTVLTDVKVSPHDSEPYMAKATSMFAPSNISSFGYTLVYSYFTDNTVSF